MAIIGGSLTSPLSFTGRAVYDTGFFPDIAEDVSPLVSIISPYETPLLTILGDPPYAAKHTLHEWLEDELGPNTIVTAAIVASNATADAVVAVASGVGAYLQLGGIVAAPDQAAGPEYFRIVGIAGPNTITLSRAFGGTQSSSYGSGVTLSIISEAANDGSDVLESTARPRPRRFNTTHIFKKDIIVSGTVMSLNLHGGIDNEYDYEMQKKLREALRDLEKAVIRGRASGNTLGGASVGAVRTFDGLLARITSNVSSWGTLTDSALTSSIKLAWDSGAQDLDLILCGDAVKRQIDTFNATRDNVFQDGQSPGGELFKQRISGFECTYGMFPVMLDRWMPRNRFAIISTSRVAILPLQGRSFQSIPVAKTGDSIKCMLLGEYTMELRNQEGMVQGYVG